MTEYPVDLSGWTLESDGKIFKLGRGTVVRARNKIMLSPKLTNFSIADKASLKLFTPTMEEVPSAFAPIAERPKKTASPSPDRSGDAPLGLSRSPDYQKTEPEVLLASSVASGNDPAEPAARSLVVPAISILFIGAC